MTIPINRPEKVNTPRGKTSLELCDGFERAGDDEFMVVLVAGGDAPHPEELTHWMAERMTHFIVPRHVRVVDDVPRTPTEHLQKNTPRDEGMRPGT